MHSLPDFWLRSQSLIGLFGAELRMGGGLEPTVVYMSMKQDSFDDQGQHPYGLKSGSLARMLILSSKPPETWRLAGFPLHFVGWRIWNHWLFAPPSQVPVVYRPSLQPTWCLFLGRPLANVRWYCWLTYGNHHLRCIKPCNGING